MLPHLDVRLGVLLGVLVSATRVVNATAGTSVKKNFECNSGSQPALSHCPNYDPSNAIQAAAAWIDLGECTGTAAAPTPSNKPTYAKWTGSGCPAAWVDGFAYEGGDLAEVNGNVYKCSTTPFVNAWCGNPSYKPGDSTYWQQAWTLLGSCTGTMSPSKAPSFSTIKSAGGCPEPYAASTTYEAGDKVEANGLAYQCRSWPNSAWCSMNGYEPDGPNSKDAWTLLGYCSGSIAPTSSPNFAKLADAGGCPKVYSDASSYEAGDKVSIEVNPGTILIYECQSFPNSGYCSQYEPGHWSKLGWTLKGYCDGTISPTKAPSFVSLTDNNGCPKVYSATATYEANDKVSTDLDGTNSLVWKCSSDIHLSRYCSQYEPGNPAKLGWSLVGHCDGTIAPSKAPTFSKLTDITGGCPRVYSKTTKYEEGDLVSVVVSADPARAVVYECKGWPQGAYCNAGENFSPESANAAMGWTLKGSCTGTMTPTASPIAYPDPKCRWYNGTQPVIIRNWSAGSLSTYTAGTRVRKHDRIYKCKSYPYSLWCKMAAYEPETTAYWADAWTKAGTCLGMFEPTGAPSVSPTKSPSKSPTKSPSKSPTKSPTKSPSKSPTTSPTKSPSKSPTKSPSKSPTTSPTNLLLNPPPSLPLHLPPPALLVVLVPHALPLVNAALAIVTLQTSVSEVFQI
eukprot:CCRYP_017186-RA/>CCRYP_017186-RA protein AED:0.06 eAED:0.06 QI:222/0.5/0.33/1/0.5/0.33/3/309/676